MRDVLGVSAGRRGVMDGDRCGSSQRGMGFAWSVLLGVVAVLGVVALPATAQLSGSINAHTSAIAAPAATTFAGSYSAHSGDRVTFSFTSLNNTMNFVPNELATAGDVDLSLRLTDAVASGTNTIVVPWVGIAVAVVHSASVAPLTLTLQLCARIFSGHITRWDDSELVALNPSLAAFNSAIEVVYPATQDDAMNIFELELRDDYFLFNSTWLRSVATEQTYGAVMSRVATDSAAIGIVPWLEPYRSSIESGSASVASARFRDISGFDVALDTNLNSIKACVDVESALDSSVYDLGRDNYGCYPIAGTMGIVADKSHLSTVDGSCDSATVLVDAVRWFTGLHEAKETSTAAAELAAATGAYLIADKSRAVELQINNVIRNITCDSMSILAVVDLSCTTRDIAVVPGKCDVDAGFKRSVAFSWKPTSTCSSALGTSVTLPAPVTRDCDYVKSGSAPMIYAVVCGSIFVCLTLAVLAIVVTHRNHEAYAKYERTYYTDVLYLVSLVLISVNIFNVVGENTNSVCLYRMWCVHISCSIFLGALFQKIWETERFYNKSAMKVLDALFDVEGNDAARKRGISLAERVENTLNAHVFNVEDARGYYIVLAIVCFDVLLLTVWSCVSAPGTKTDYELVAYSDVVLPVTSCGANHSGIFLSMLVGYKLMIVCYSLMLSYKIKNVRSEFNEIRLLSSVLPNCILAGFVMVVSCALPSSNLSAGQEAIVLVTLWTWQLSYALLAVFHFRMWVLFPVSFDNFHHSVCCCLPLPDLANRDRGVSLAQGAAYRTSGAAASSSVPVIVHMRDEEKETSRSETPRPRGPSVSPAEVTMVAIETMTKRLLAKDAEIAARDVRIRKLEEQLAMVLHDLENDAHDPARDNSS